MALKIKTLEDALKVNANHMWRNSSGLTIEDQIKVREFRVQRLKELLAPEIILIPEIKKLEALKRKALRETKIGE